MSFLHICLYGLSTYFYVMDQLTNELQSTKEKLLVTLKSFSQEEFNILPLDGGWTAGQTTKHTLLAVGDLPAAMMGKTQPTVRNPEEHVKMLRDMFLNFDHKMQSPAAINPPQDDYDKITLTKALETAFDKLIKMEQTEDLTLTCTDMEFPTIGQLTRIELLNFAAVHTVRHTHQLANIKKAL